MSALVDEPSHFCEWGNFDSNDFVPRALYGKYLSETLAKFINSNSNASITHLKDEASAISAYDEKIGYQATFKSVPAENFEVVVLALGQGVAAKHPALSSVQASSLVTTDAWREKSPDFVGTLACIGTGLTFIDHALSHLRKNPANRVIGISRNGLLPEPHLAKRAAPLEVPAEARKSSDAIYRFINESPDWRAAQDGVRHELPDIWFSWSEAEKSEFLATKLRWWNVHRHRISPEISGEVQEALQDGRLRVLRDNLADVRIAADSLLLQMSSGEEIPVDQLVNCLGYEVAGTGTLIETLCNAQLTKSGPLGQGISTNYPAHQTLNSSGAINSNLYAIGPVLTGERFETTAIPEIKVQAQEISESILHPTLNL